MKLISSFPIFLIVAIYGINASALPDIVPAIKDEPADLTDDTATSPAEEKVQTPKEDETPQLEDAHDKAEEKEEDQEGNEEFDIEGDDENDVQETEDEDENAVEESDEDARDQLTYYGKKKVFEKFRICGAQICRRNCYKWCRSCKKQCYRKCYRFRVRHGDGYKYSVKCLRPNLGCKLAGCGKSSKVPVKFRG